MTPTGSTSSGTPTARTRAVGRVARLLERKGAPRTLLLLVVAAAGAAAFVASFAMLRMGVTAMWLRYPLAILVGYGCFLVLLWIWVRHMPRPRARTRWASEEHHANATADTIADATMLDDGQGWMLVAAGLATVLIACFVASATFAPTLLAEVIVDALFAGSLYRRMRQAGDTAGIGTMIGRTVVPALVVAVAALVAGLALRAIAPSATTMWEAIAGGR